MSYVDFDDGTSQARRREAVLKAHALVASRPDDPALKELAELVIDARRQLLALPLPLMEHLPALAVYVGRERDIAREYRRVMKAAEVPA